MEILVPDKYCVAKWVYNHDFRDMHIGGILISSIRLKLAFHVDFFAVMGKSMMPKCLLEAPNYQRQFYRSIILKYYSCE